MSRRLRYVYIGRNKRDKLFEFASNNPSTEIRGSAEIRTTVDQATMKLAVPPDGIDFQLRGHLEFPLADTTLLRKLELFVGQFYPEKRHFITDESHGKVYSPSLSFSSDFVNFSCQAIWSDARTLVDMYTVLTHLPAMNFLLSLTEDSLRSAKLKLTQSDYARVLETRASAVLSVRTNKPILAGIELIPLVDPERFEPDPQVISNLS